MVPQTTICRSSGTGESSMTSYHRTRTPRGAFPSLGGCAAPAWCSSTVTAWWLARRGEHDEAVELLDRVRAEFRGCRSEDWLSATLDLLDAHLRREDLAAVTRITWDLRGELAKDGHNWAAPVSSAVSVFCRSGLGASPTLCELRIASQDLRGAVGHRGLLV